MGERLVGDLGPVGDVHGVVGVLCSQPVNALVYPISPLQWDVPPIAENPDERRFQGIDLLHRIKQGALIQEFPYLVR